jgi:hypothetical protein
MPLDPAESPPRKANRGFLRRGIATSAWNLLERDRRISNGTEIRQRGSIYTGNPVIRGPTVSQKDVAWDGIR